MEYELKNRGMNGGREVELPVRYKDIVIGTRKVDFLIENKICVELKATTNLEDAHLAQALNYLEASNLEVGLLLNFGSSSLQIKRLHNKKFEK